MIAKPEYTISLRPGAALQRSIHRAVNVLPLPQRTKLAIRSCAGCARRAKVMDEMWRRVTDKLLPGKG